MMNTQPIDLDISLNDNSFGDNNSHLNSSPFRPSKSTILTKSPVPLSPIREFYSPVSNNTHLNASNNASTLVNNMDSPKLRV